jgi:Flp pilus assembly protein TadG
MGDAMKRVLQRLREQLGSVLARCAAMREDSGQALIEAALGMSVCVTLLLGAAELGRVSYAAIEVANAAHAGVAYGCLSHTDASDNSGMQLAATQEAPDVSGISATASHFCKCSDGTASTCAVSDCSLSRIVEYVQVTTSATYDPKIYVPGMPHSYALNGNAVMRVVQ